MACVLQFSIKCSNIYIYTGNLDKTDIVSAAAILIMATTYNNARSVVSRWIVLMEQENPMNNIWHRCLLLVFVTCEFVFTLFYSVVFVASRKNFDFNSHFTTRQVPLVEQELLTLPEFALGFQWGSCCSVFSFLCCVFCRLLCVPSFFLVLALCCLSFFDLRIMITRLVYSNLSYNQYSIQCTYMCIRFELYLLNIYIWCLKNMRHKMYVSDHEKTDVWIYFYLFFLSIVIDTLWILLCQHTK